MSSEQGAPLKDPIFLEHFLDEAEKQLASGIVERIEFSGGTYLIHIDDKGETICAFIQIGEDECLGDFFCSCDSDSSDGCLHLAIACLRIYQKYDEPLHIFHQHSLWNHVCALYADAYGYDPVLLEKLEPGHYVCKETGGQSVFTIRAKTEAAQEKLTDYIEYRSEETEETSIKFSGLPLEEITKWKEGRPSPELLYELSFWADLAKWMTLAQEADEDYEITYKTAKNGLPNFFRVEFSSFQVEFSLLASELVNLIPGLKTVKSPLKVLEKHGSEITSIHYDPHKVAFRIYYGSELLADHFSFTDEELQKAQKIEDSNWLYIDGQGFYDSSIPEKPSKTWVREREISAYIQENWKLLKKFS